MGQIYSFNNKEVTEDPEQQSQKPDNRRRGSKPEVTSRENSSMPSLFAKHNNQKYTRIFIYALSVRWRKDYHGNVFLTLKFDVQM